MSHRKPSTEYDGRHLPINEIPPPYKAEYAQRVADASGAGFTRIEIARLIGVGLDTLILWEMCYPSFATAIRRHNETRTERVEQSLYQRAVGYEYLAEKAIYTKDNGVIRTNVVVHVPPDTSAAHNWLKAHKPEIWGEKEAKDQDGKITVEMKYLTGLPNMRDPDKQVEDVFKRGDTEEEI